MKKILSLLFIVSFTLSAFSQDTIPQPKMLLRPFIANGISFIRNDALKHNYSTQSIYHWGGGLQIANLDILKVVPYVQVLFSKFSIEDKMNNSIIADCTLKMKQIIGGFIIPVKKINKGYIRSKISYSYSIIDESFYEINKSVAHGFEIGLGCERRIGKKHRVFLDVSYNFQKTGKSKFRDFDVSKVSFGFVL